MGALPMESVHPLVVHFPIALLVTAFVLDAWGLALNRSPLHRVALWNLALGTLGAGVAVWTGYRAAEIAKHSFEIHRVMELHRQLGLATLIGGGLLVAWRLWRRDRFSRQARVLAVVGLLGVTGTLAYGAHLGGRLVYEFGVGGSFGKSLPTPMEQHEHHHTQ